MLLILIAVSINCSSTTATEPAASSSEKQILLLGIQHFNTLCTEGLSQTDVDDLNTEVKGLIGSICEFAPERIYVEFDRGSQAALDSLVSASSSQQVDLSDEITSLAAPIANCTDEAGVVAVDIDPGMLELDSLIASLNVDQFVNFEEISNAYISEVTNETDSLWRDAKSLRGLLMHLNSEAFRNRELMMLNTILATGGKANELGVGIVLDCYRKHLDILSFILKDARDHEAERILVIYGASHVALFDWVLVDESGWGKVSLEELLGYSD